MTENALSRITSYEGINNSQSARFDNNTKRTSEIVDSQLFDVRKNLVDRENQVN